MTQPITPATDPRLDEWGKLANAATPGPWRTDLNVTSWSVLAPEWKRVCSGDIPDSLWRGPLEERAASVYIADMRFIAAAREAIPALIAMVRVRDAKIALLKKQSHTLETGWRIADDGRIEAEARATAAEADAAAARTRVRWLRNGLEEITGVGFDAPATFAGSDAEWERNRANTMQAIARRALGRAEA
jgi:hypothetical protein